MYTDVQAEPLARAKIEAQGFGTFLPYYQHGTWRAGRLYMREKPLFPRYLFVHVPHDAVWSSLVDTDGVHHVLLAGDAPARIPEQELAEAMLAHADGRHNVIAPRRDLRGRFRKRRRRRRRPRHGKVATGKPCGISPPGSPQHATG
jgi:transcriptional antiterminator RfaH